MQTLDAIDAASLREDIPSFRPGDTVKVHVRVVEGNRTRVQVFRASSSAATAAGSARRSPCAR